MGEREWGGRERAGVLVPSFSSKTAVKLLHAILSRFYNGVLSVKDVLLLRYPMYELAASLLNCHLRTIADLGSYGGLELVAFV